MQPSLVRFDLSDTSLHVLVASSGIEAPSCHTARGKTRSKHRRNWGRISLKAVAAEDVRANGETDGVILEAAEIRVARPQSEEFGRRTLLPVATWNPAASVEARRESGKTGRNVAAPQDAAQMRWGLGAEEMFFEPFVEAVNGLHDRQTKEKVVKAWL